MVKPLNKEWELFGPKYRVIGAKGEKVDCNACHKQVSAAVNRLQSHLRVCPARPALPAAIAAHLHGQSSSNHSHASGSDLEDNSTTAGLGDDADAVSGTSDHLGGDGSLESSVGGTAAPSAASHPGEIDTMAIKRQRTSSSPTRAFSATAVVVPTAPSSRERNLRWGSAVTDDVWLTSAASSSSSPAAFAKKRLEIEEKRFLLELQREQREQKRERFQLEILEAQARKEKLAAEKEAYEARVLLALSRKQLRDQGVTEAEIDRVLPVEPLGATLTLTATATTNATAPASATATATAPSLSTSHAAAAAANAVAAAALEMN